METTDTAAALAGVFAELVDGVIAAKGGFVLNTGDAGLLKSLDRLSSADASRSTNGGATIAAHAQHLRYGLSLMNDWAARGGDPFSNAEWDEAWKISAVDEATWTGIRQGLRDEAHGWLRTLGSPRTVMDVEFAGMIASVAHLAYHLGAIRQIHKDSRGPTEGTF
jgi:hypothetical protein